MFLVEPVPPKRVMVEKNHQREINRASQSTFWRGTALVNEDIGDPSPDKKPITIPAKPVGISILSKAALNGFSEAI